MRIETSPVRAATVASNILVHQRFFAKVHDVCGQGSWHLVKSGKRHYVIFEELARPSSHPLRPLLGRMRMANVGAWGPLQPVCAVCPEARALPVQHGFLVATIVHILPGQPLDDVSSLEETCLRILNHPKARLPVGYNVQAALHNSVRALQVPRRLGASSGFRILGAWRRAPYEVGTIEAERRIFPA